VPGSTRRDSARIRRDLSLALRRRLTVYAAIGATALTAICTLVAAATIPGKTQTATEPVTQPDPASAPVVTQPALNPPGQLPQSGFGEPPAVISGGS
jgi:hypothetical protein